MPSEKIKFEALYVHSPEGTIQKRQGSTNFPKFYKPPLNSRH